MSPKRASLQRKYRAFVAGMLAVDERCEMPRWILQVDAKYRDCTGLASGLHHRRKRSAGGALMDPDNVLRSCDPCNGWVEDHPARAEKVGLVVRAGHPDYHHLGAG